MSYSVYVRNHKQGASCYYRVIQYTNSLVNCNVNVNDLMTQRMYRQNLDNSKKWFRLPLKALHYLIMCFRLTIFLLIDLFKKPSIIIIQRTTIPRYTPFFLKILMYFAFRDKNIIWDFDDDIFLSGEISRFEARLLLKYSNKIVVTSEYLKTKIDKKYTHKIVVLPTTDGDFQSFDLNKVKYKRIQALKNEIRLIWVATSSNIPSILNIIRTLDNAANIIKKEYDKKLILYIVCNEGIFYETKHLILKNIKWSREASINYIWESHIGIMPLLNNQFSLGKGGFKLIQYMSTGLPVIASDIGFNSTVVDNTCGKLVDDIKDSTGWIEAIIEIGIDLKEWEKYSESSYIRWLSKFSFQSNLRVWSSMINDIVKDNEI